MFRRLLESSILRRQDDGGGGRGGVVAATGTLTRAQVCMVMAAHYRQHHAGQFFQAIPGIEDADLPTLRATPTVGTNVAPAIAALHAAGINVPANLGGLMDGAQLTEKQVHDIACDCLIHGAMPGAERMATLFETAGRA